MTNEEVRLPGTNNLPEGNLRKPINQSKFGFDLQWFAEEGGEGDGGTGGEGDPGTAGEGDQGAGSQGDPQKTDLPGWIQGLTAEQREKYAEELKDIPKVSDFFNNHIELKERLKSAIIKPGEGATEQELADYRKALGVPETKDGYYLKKPELPEGLGEAVSEDWFRELAFKHNLSKQQAADLFEDYYKSIGDAYTKQLAERKKEREEAEKSLREEHGNQYEEKLSKAKLAANNVFGAEFMSYLDETGLGNDIRLITGLIRLGELVGEDSLVGGRISTPLGQTDGGWHFPNTPGME